MAKKIRLALAGLKGGIGKTTLSMVLGSILKETYGMKVCFVDADYFQYLITAQSQRERIFCERKANLASEVFGEHGMDATNLPEVPVFRMEEGFELTTPPEKVEEAFPDYDVYIYDFMGSQGYDVTYEYLTKMDYVILPTVLDSINARPTYYWMRGVAFAKSLLTGRGEEIRLKKAFLLFNQYRDDETLFSLKSVLEDQAAVHEIETLQNVVRYFSGASRDVTCVSEENKDYFISVRIQPSKNYMEESNVGQVAEEVFLAAGIIEEKKQEPKPTEDPLELHEDILDDLRSQIEELGVFTEQATSTMANMSDKYKEILDTYRSLCSMTVEEIKQLFGRERKVLSVPTEEDPFLAAEVSSQEAEEKEEEKGGDETPADSPAQNVEDSNAN